MVKGFACTGTGAVTSSNVTVTSSARWRRYVRCSVGAAVAAAVFLLSACGGGTVNQQTSLRSFTVAFSLPMSSLDTVRGGAVPIQSFVTDPLVISGRACKITPQLATSISYPDPKTMVFHLRPGVRFSNGDPLTAEDVAWSIKRTFAAGSILQATLPTFKSVSVTGPQEVTLRLTKATPAVLCGISFTVYIGSKKYGLQHGADYGTSAAPPIGTGPYKIAKYDANGVTLVRNPYYWGPKFPVQRIRFVPIGDDNTAQLAMRSKQIQAEWAIGNPQTLAAWKAIPGAKVVAAAGSSSYFVSLDVSQAPLNDIHVRKAIAYAVDKKGLANSVAPGFATPLKGMTTAEGSFESVAPSPAAAEQFLDSLPQYDFDPAKAKAELAQSAYPHGFTMRLPYQPSNSASQLIALSLKQNLQSIGIKVQLKPLSAAQFYTESGLLSTHPGAQILTAWQTVAQDPTGGLALAVGKANAADEKANGSTGGNFANFDPPGDVERAWHQMTQSVDNATRWQGVQTALRAIATQVPYVPILNLPQLVAVGDGLSFTGPVSISDMANNQWIYKLR